MKGELGHCWHCWFLLKTSEELLKKWIWKKQTRAYARSEKDSGSMLTFLSFFLLSKVRFLFDKPVIHACQVFLFTISIWVESSPTIKLHYSQRMEYTARFWIHVKTSGMCLVAVCLRVKNSLGVTWIYLPLVILRKLHQIYEEKFERKKNGSRFGSSLRSACHAIIWLRSHTNWARKRKLESAPRLASFFEMTLSLSKYANRCISFPDKSLFAYNFSLLLDRFIMKVYIFENVRFAQHIYRLEICEKDV